LWGYIDSTPTLGGLIAESDHIAVLEVDRVNRDRKVILFKSTADLKGKGPAGPVKHQITEGFHPRQSLAVLDWAEAGQTAICFRRGDLCRTCIGRSWYDCATGADSWWTMTAARPELSYAYSGSPVKLRDHVAAILAGREVVVTALKYQVMSLAPGPGRWLERRPEHWATYEAVGSGRLMRGKEWPVWRIRASFRMPAMTLGVVRDPEKYIAGMGPAGPEDVPALAKALSHEDARVRIEAAEDLALVGPPAAPGVPALLRICREASDPLLRVGAAGAVASIDPKNEAARSLLIEALKDRSDKVRKRAAESLGDLGPGAAPAVGALVEAVKDPDPAVSWTAVDALGQVGPDAEAAVPTLIAACKEARLRGAAVEALGLIGRKARAAVPALEQVLRGDDVRVRWAAAAALVRIGGPGVKAGVRYFLAIPPGGRGLYDAENILVGPAAPEALRELLDAVRDPALRDTATRVLRDKNFLPLTPDQLTDVRGFVKDPDPGVRCVAAWVLHCRRAQTGAAVDDKDFIEVQRQTLKASDPWARRQAAQLLGTLGPYGKDAEAALSAVLDDPDAGVREAAAAALKGIQRK
jgi:HEAT repeat protein